MNSFMISAIFHSTPRLSSRNSPDKGKTQSWRMVTDTGLSGIPDCAPERVCTLDIFYFVMPERYKAASGIPHVFREKFLDRAGCIC